MKKIITILAFAGVSLGMNGQNVFPTNGNVGIGTASPTEKLHVNGNINVKDIISEGENAWIFHTPEDESKTLFIIPNETNGTNGWNWSSQTRFKNDGKVFFSNDIDVSGIVNSSYVISNASIVSQGENGWIFHTPDDERKSLFIAPSGVNGWNWSNQTCFKNDGKVFFGNNIGVKGKIETKQIKVTNTPTADFVFESNYNLPTLTFVEKHIKEKKHLPEIASAKKMKENGVDIGKFQIQLLQKIEELTLYTIEQEKKIKALEEQNKLFNTQNNVLLIVQKRLDALEKNNLK